jgi:hypothetical protein
MQEKRHVIGVLIKAKQAIKDRDINGVRGLSNQTLHSASIYQDADNIAIAVILYSLSKILERSDYHSYPGWKRFERIYVQALDHAIEDLKNNDLEHYRAHIGEIRAALDKIGGRLKISLKEVFRRASINKASRLHEHGLSLHKTAKILGVTLWELNQYVGRTGIADVNLAYTLELDKRIKLAQDAFAK